MHDFKSGLFFWWRGWGHIFSHRQLLLLTLIPALLTFVFAASVGWFLWNHLSLWVDYLLTWVLGSLQGTAWYKLAYYPLLASAGLIVSICVVYTAFVFQSVLAIPFYSLLADKTLILGGVCTQGNWRNFFRLLGLGFFKSVSLGVAGLILLFFSLVPILDFVAILGVLLIMSFECLDYSFDCMEYDLRQRVAFMWRQRFLWLGMAAGMAFTFLVPGLTILVFPGAVVGGALIFKDRL